MELCLYEVKAKRCRRTEDVEDVLPKKCNPVHM